MSRKWMIRGLGGWALGLTLLCGGAASAFSSYGTAVDTKCTANGWVPAKPFNPNGGNAGSPSQVNCGLCHTNGSNPGSGLTAGGDTYRRSGYSDVTPFCSAAVVNAPPVFTAVAAQTATAGTVFTLNVSATDPERTLLILTVANAPTGSTFSDAGNGTGTFRWTPTTSQLGAHTLTFHASDTGTPMAVASMDVTIAVGQAVNLPPVLTPIGNQQLDPGQTLAFTLSATDPERQPLVYSATGLPAGATLVGADFSWTPDASQTGQHSIAFKVTDSGSPAASDSETIVVTVGHINRPPVLGAIGNRQIQVGSELRFAVTATDPDADAIVLGCVDLPIDAVFSDYGDGTGEVVWMPTAAARVSATCSATDTGTPPESDSETFSLTASDVVTGSGDAPRVDDASWTSSLTGGRLSVQGSLPAPTASPTALGRERMAGPALDVFAVLSDGSTVLLGSRRTSRTRNFQLDLEPFIAPCSVAVGNAGAMSSAISVRNAPADCERTLLARARASLACAGTSLQVSGVRGPIGGQIIVSDGSDGALLGIFPVGNRDGRFGGTATFSVAPTTIDLRAQVGQASWSLETPVPVTTSRRCNGSGGSGGGDDEDEDESDDLESESQISTGTSTSTSGTGTGTGTWSARQRTRRHDD